MPGIRPVLDSFNLRADRPRIFRSPKLRTARRKSVVGPAAEMAGDQSGEPLVPPPLPSEEEEEEEDDEALEPQLPRSIASKIDRETLCLPHFEKETVIHRGDDGFADILHHYFPTAESDAVERLVRLKTRLRAASTYDFWAILMEEICNITDAQCGFVSKRILVDDQNSAVEMPELGDPGSCLMGVAFYLNNGTDFKEMYRDYRYHAYETPCAYMKYDKVFIVPEKLTDFVRDNPNRASLPWTTSEAFIGVPLFCGGKGFAHFGLLWSSEGAARRKLSWTFIETFLHALEDMILQRLLEGGGFAKNIATPESESETARVIPLAAITASQSLKPYARSLSHELRTPMQGVVGMLDIMYATVLDAITSQPNERVRAVFNDLKKHIEVVQDSSRRAVEAADNVVHAYDLNMQMPETPLTPEDSDQRRILGPSDASMSRSGSPATDSRGTSTPQGKKRRPDAPDFHGGPPLKKMFRMTQKEFLRGHESRRGSEPPTRASTPADGLSDSLMAEGLVDDQLSLEKRDCPSMTGQDHRPVSIREFMGDLVNNTLRGLHPAKEVHVKQDLGESIELQTLGPRGELQDRRIHVEIGEDVPKQIVTDEQPFHFAIQKVVDNALKFTEDGDIKITVRLGRNPQMVEICVTDTGCGIAEDAQRSLFTPHFQEDAAINRSRDGLGLSLFNAKAQVRKILAGDITLERSATDGPLKGSEFLVRLPISSPPAIPINSVVLGPPQPSSSFARPALSSSSPCLSSKQTSSTSTTTILTDDFSAFASQTQTPLPTPPPPSISHAIMTPSTDSRKRPLFDSHLAQTRPLNILIAEDNSINRNVVIGSLCKLGYTDSQLTIAFDGCEAVRHYARSLARAPDQHFDLVLMDIWMPNMDGYEATRRILEMGDPEKDPIIVAVTADITGDCAARAKEVGMKGFLAKPFKVLDVQRLIEFHFPEE